MLALAAVLTLTAACGGDDEGGAGAVRPVLDQIEPAMAAVDAERGGPQQYYEVNATPQFVNLFVAEGTDQVQAYLYVDGELQPPTPPQDATGLTFGADAVAFDPDELLSGVDEELPGSDITVLALAAGADGRVQYIATLESERGGVLDVTLDADGTVLSVDPRL